MSRILAADLGGPAWHKAHEFGSYALAAATPAAVISSKGSTLEKVADWTLAVAIPIHTHISMNAVVTDYVPKALRGPARVGVLGMSLITYLGIMKVNLSGPGLTSTVKTLWRKPESTTA